MSIQISVVMLAVRDVDRAKRFYVEGLGCEVRQDYPGFVRCRTSEGSSDLALYEWDASAVDAGVDPEGTGYRGVSLHFTADSRDVVNETMQRAVNAGGTVVKQPTTLEWGGYEGYFADPDGHLWKVATAG